MGVARLPALQARLPYSALLLVLALTPGRTRAEKFKCPAFTKLTTDSFVFQDPNQCDKYWTCVKGTPTRSLCPDGLVYHPDKPNGEDPCDLTANVPDKCKGRENLQRPKPGDSFCPRQYGVYPSSLPWECDTYYTCQNGKSSRTKCAEGLHYSENVGICVWARDSGREECNAEEEPRERKKKGGRKEEENKPERKVAEKLANGFVCPGGPNGVHPALKHPDDCRLYYVCLNGLDPSEAGCPPGKVFNPRHQQCDMPANVDGCEDYYNPAAKKKKADLATSLGADLDSNDFSMFIKLLKSSGVLNGKLLQGGNGGGFGGLEQSGRPGRPGGRPGPGGLHGGRPGPRPRRPGRQGRPGRPGGRAGRPRRPLRPRVQLPSYDDYDSYYIYDDDYQESVAGPEYPVEAEAKSEHRQTEQFRDRVDASRVTPLQPKSEEGVEVLTVRAPVSKGLFAVPESRKNKFTARFTPKVRRVGNTENLAPVPSLALAEGPQSVALPVRSLGPVQHARAPLTFPASRASLPFSAPRPPPVVPAPPPPTAPSLSAAEADSLFQSLFPGLDHTEAPAVVHPGLPEPVMLHPAPPIHLPAPVIPSPVKVLEEKTPRSRNSLFSRRKNPRTVILEAKEVESDPVEEEVVTVQSVPVTAKEEETSSRNRNSLFSRRHERRQQVTRSKAVSKNIESLIPTTAASVTVTRPSFFSSRNEVQTEPEEQEDEEVSETEAPRQSNLFLPRRAFRARTSLRTTVREDSTESISPRSSQPSFSTASSRHRFHAPTSPPRLIEEAKTEESSPVETTEENTPHEEFLTPTALPFIRRRGFQNFLNSRSRGSSDRHKLTVGPGLVKPEPEIPGSHSPLSSVPASHLPAPVPINVTPVPAIPASRPITTPSPAVLHSSPTLPHTSPALKPRRPSIARARPALSHSPALPQPRITTVRLSQKPRFLDLSQTESAVSSSFAEPRQDRLQPAFLKKPHAARALFVSQESFPEEDSLSAQGSFSEDRFLLNEVSSDLPPASKPPQSRRTFPPAYSTNSQTQTGRRRGDSRHSQEPSITSPARTVQTRLLSGSSSEDYDDSDNQHKIAMQARFQLQPYLPEGENEGDALEKLRAKIASLQDTNRHRGRG